MNQHPSSKEAAMWASQKERDDQFRIETVIAPRFDFRVVDIFDNGEFFTSAKLELMENGVVVDVETFDVSSEFPNDGTAAQQATSFGVAWIESREVPFEEALAPFGPEWHREREERSL